MSQWNSFSEGGDILAHVSGKLADVNARTLIRGRLHNQSITGPGYLAYVPDLSVSGHVTYSKIQKMISTWDDVTHEHVHYHTDGVTVKAYASAGKHYTTDDHVHSANGISHLGSLTAPYWKTRQGTTVFGGATYPHTEIRFASGTGPLSGTGEHPVATFGLDSHRFYFADPFDTLYYQISPTQFFFPTSDQIATGLAVSALANPTVAIVALPSGGGSSFLAGTYTLAYCWKTAGGARTLLSPSTSVAISAGSDIFTSVPSLPSGATAAEVYLQDAGGTYELAASGAGPSFTLLGPVTNVTTRSPVVNTTGLAANMSAVLASNIPIWQADGARFRLWTTDGPFIFDHSTIITPAGVAIDGLDATQSGRVLVTTLPSSDATSKGDYGVLSVVFPRTFASAPDVDLTSEDAGWIPDVENITTTGFDVRLSRRSSLMSVEIGVSSSIAISAANNSGPNTVLFGVTFETAPTAVIVNASSQDVIPVVSNITINSFDVTLHYRPGVVTGTVSTISAQTITSSLAGGQTPLSSFENATHNHVENTAAAYAQNATTAVEVAGHKHTTAVAAHTHDTTIPAVTPTFTGTLQNVSATYTVSWMTKGLRAAPAVSKSVRWLAHAQS